MALFKYTSVEYISSCIENGVYASELDNINDPYEDQGIRYRNQYRVVCLTSSPFQMLMWSYYGNHKGCCIEYDIDKIIGIQKVDYIRKFQAHEHMRPQEIVASLYKKGYEWRHEKESRLVYYEPKADKRLWKVDGDKVYLIAPVKKIIFGYLAERDEKYQEMLEYIKKYNDSHDQKIEVTKCCLMQNKYRLVGDKQFDITAELQRIKKKKQ